MPKDYSPFTPGLPVSVEFFVGRLAEVTKLSEKVRAAISGRLQVVFLTGERGIGKSSLASFARFISERDHQILGIHTFLGGVSSLEEMVRRVFDRLLKDSVGKSWHSRVREFFGNHIREVGLFGVTLEFGAPPPDLGRMVDDFAPALRNLVARLQDEKRGILLVLDDINGLASSAAFANWLKSLVDEIATSRDSLPCCVVLVGLEERRQTLVSLQPSLARVFDLIEIRPWTEEETREFFRSALSKVSVTIEQDALEMLVRYAGGLPVLAHEIGDAVFKLDQDDRIDRDDALHGIVAAADIVGRKHLEPRVFQAIRSARYRAILRKAPTEPFLIRFKRSALRARLKEEEVRVLDNFLTRMKELGVIHPDPDAGPGGYRFDNMLHCLYFWLEAQRAKETHEA